MLRNEWAGIVATHKPTGQSVRVRQEWSARDRDRDDKIICPTRGSLNGCKAWALRILRCMVRAGKPSSTVIRKYEFGDYERIADMRTGAVVTGPAIEKVMHGNLELIATKRKEASQL